MIIQLQPEQISDLWEGIKHGIVQVGRITGGDIQGKLNNVLRNLLSGRFQCWIIYDELEDGKKIHALGITYVLKDKLTNDDELIIYTLYGYRKISDELAVDAIDKLKAYAKAVGCVKIHAFTKNKRVTELMELTNFKSEYQFYSLEVT